MSVYHYSAYDAGGRRVRGRVEAPDLGAVEAQVRALGLWLSRARPSTARRPQVSAGRVRPVPARELVGFFIEMSLLLQAGVTLPRALQRQSSDLGESRLGPALAVLRDRVAAGTPLHRAMTELPRVFRPQAAALVQAGEAGGTLAETFASLAAHYEWLDRLKADIRQAMIYPAFVLAATLSLVIGLFTFIVPRFVDLLAGLAIRVPPLTRVVMAISSELTRHGALLLALAAAPPVLWLALARSARGRRLRDGGILRLPGFGRLTGMFAFSRLAQNLGMLYRAGIPLLRGLEICRGLVGNAEVAAAVERAGEQVARGVALSQALASQRIFPAGMVTMIAAGEASGRLDFALQSVAAYYNQIIPRRIKTMFAVFDPVIMLCLIATVGVVALAVVQPLLQLWQAR